MTRTVPAGIAAQLAAGHSTLARCLRLDLRDGASIGFTDHDVDLTVNLGDGDLTYLSRIGITPSAISLAIGLDADNLEIRGPLGDDVSRIAVLGGRYNRARARVFDVDWSSPADFIRLLAGKVTGANVEAGQFVFEIRSNTDAFNQTIGRLLSPQCSHDFGVGQCQATPATFSGVLDAVTDDLTFHVAWSGAAPTVDQVRNGLVTFTSGALAGTLPVEVFNLSGATVEVYQPLVDPPAVGDAVTLSEGCDKLRATCKLKGQILNFGGFPDMTGSDQYIKYPIPTA